MAKSYVGTGGCGVMQESHLLVFGSWLSGVWHGIAHGVQIQKKTSTVADRRTTVHASRHTWDKTCIIVADERGCKFYISVWDHAFFCGGECRVMYLKSGMRGMLPSRSVVCVECETQKETCTNGTNGSYGHDDKGLGEFTRQTLPEHS